VGIYTEYLNKQMDFKQMQGERRNMLKKISTLRDDRDILAITSDLTKSKVPIQIDYTDLLPVNDLLTDLKGKQIDIILETPGGFAEVVEDIVRILRGKYEKVSIIIPGYAKSAGTIFTMSGDEILMGKTSALGPIDAQIIFNNKRISADAFLDGFESIKSDVESTGKLNPTYIPILQNISPGEIQHCKHVQAFSSELVTRWLENYKFKSWETHSTTGNKVTDEERHNRAKEIGSELSSQSRWFTHARSITIDDLEIIGLKITDFSLDNDLNDAIMRYYTLMRMAFESTAIYKIFETNVNTIYRFGNQPSVPPLKNKSDSIILDVNCPKCKKAFQMQVNLKKGMPKKEGVVQYPISDDNLKCPHCNFANNVSALRLQIEGQTNKKVVE